MPLQIDNMLYDIDWDTFLPNQTCFIPCIGVEIAKNEILTAALANNAKIVTQTQVENEILGIRIWRLPNE